MQDRYISVLCPVYNEYQYIKSFIESILSQDYSKDLVEVLFIDGESNDFTREIIEDFSKRVPFIKLLDNKERAVSQALNIGIKASRGDIVIRMDAHCIYPTNYFSVLVDNLIELNADNVGGVLITKPGNNSAIAKAIAIAVSHPFGVGNSFFRIGLDKVMAVDTVPFGCFRRDIFDKIGFFDADLIRNQDDEFNARIIKNGGKIFLIPEIVITYFARDKISKLWQMFFQYGLFKPLVNKKIGSPTSLRQFIPLLFVLGLILGFLLSIVSKSILLITSAIFFLYFLMSFYLSVSISIKYNDINLFFLMPLMFFVIHLSYGFGYMSGIIKFLVLNRKSTKVKGSR
jgi:glycosyltransferase involved in cell wall biosynthesis